MGKKYSEIPNNLTQFIESQKIFFVGTAAADGRVNISPKGMDSFRILDANRVLWLSVTGSGNETSAHVQENPRMTIMFIALEGSPMILRLYGNARVIHKSDSDWEECASLFELLPGTRQIFDLTIDLVHTSCGMGVPFYNYTGERDQLNAWANKKGEEGIKEYWREKNEESLDGKITHIIEKNI
ncbi:MAG TPA: pyridoxamine 5'-phosphate oxidase family protein [Gammaproteobacteria bacterium]|nr:pyridoxamine 5'-phosphate oxidase family protein [Gammaproteobacteria bacterium]